MSIGQRKVPRKKSTTILLPAQTEADYERNLCKEVVHETLDFVDRAHEFIDSVYKTYPDLKAEIKKERK